MTQKGLNDIGTAYGLGILIGAGGLFLLVLWWSKRRLQLPGILVWNAAITKSFIDGHKYMEGFYERRFRVLRHLVKRLPPKRKAQLSEEADAIGKRLESYRNAIREKSRRETISPANRKSIGSRQVACGADLLKFSRDLDRWYEKYSRHTKMKVLAWEVRIVLTRASWIRDYFQWKIVLSDLAERSQGVLPGEMASFRLAEKGSALHRRADMFFQLVRSPRCSTWSVWRSYRRFRRRLARFAQLVLKAQAGGEEKTLVLMEANQRHDRLVRLRPMRSSRALVVSNETGSHLSTLWERFESISAPGLGRDDGYLNFTIFDWEMDEASHHKLEPLLRQRIQIRVLDKVTEHWEVVGFEVHFGRHLVFRADWLARAREVAICMSCRNEKKECRFSLTTIEHRSVAIHPIADCR